MKTIALFIGCFIFTTIHAQNDFRLIEKKLVSKGMTDTLRLTQPWIDQVLFYDINFSSFGRKLTGYYYVPKGDGPFPTIVYNIGGNRFVHHFSHEMSTRLMGKYASLGYAVIAYNYLDQKNPETLDDFGDQDVDIVVELIDHLSLFPEADTSRIGALGWSRGGLQSYLLLTKTNKIKAIAVGGALADVGGWVNWRPAMDSIMKKFIGSDLPQDEEKFYRVRNAKDKVDQFPVDVPILMVHGNSDWRVPCSESLDMARLFSERRIPYRLIIYEGGDHALTEHAKAYEAEIISWFDRYLKNGEALPNMVPHGK